MFEKLASIEDKYREMESRLSDPELIADVSKWQKLNQEHAAIAPIVEKIREYRRVVTEIKEDESLLGESQDSDLHSMINEDLSKLRAEKNKLESELPLLLMPKDPNDDKNVIMEIRGGVGGDEAALFAGDLFRMYTRYAERNGWRVSVIDSNPTGLGGFKEVSFSIEGYGAFSRLKYERGIHRVQRVPETESQGRIHTSAVTVAVLPEAEEVDVDIRPEDLRIDTYRAHGAGGQYVNRTETAIRITHVPTGVVVQCQDEKSQLKNKNQAMRVLRARLFNIALEKKESEIAASRKEQVGTGDRSGRIRTYNFPQGRVTDHRIGLTLHKLGDVLDGAIDEITNALISAERAEKMKEK